MSYHLKGILNKANHFFAAAGLAGALSLWAGAAVAQQGLAEPTMSLTAVSPAYTGPRFPGGSDSLQALLRRIERSASPALQGQAYLHIELDEQGRSQKSYFLTPPLNSPDAALLASAEVQELAKRLLQQLPLWQLTPVAPGQNKIMATSVTLPLKFGGTTPSLLVYSDENPVFPAIQVRARTATFLTAAVQMQVRYPADDLRHNRQGTVYAYVAVSEAGVLEQRRIVGSVSPTLDAEIMRVLATLPNALVPPQQQGRPVRAGYILPFSFKIQ